MSSDSEDQYARASTRKKTMGANSHPVAKCKSGGQCDLFIYHRRVLLQLDTAAMRDI